MTPHKSHNHWTLEEDQKLRDLVKSFGAKKWKTIAAKMATRDAKQCRERYHGHLCDSINRKPLTKDEDDAVVHYRNLGYGWAELSRVINETFHTIRTPNQLKNNYNQRLVKQHPNANNHNYHINNYLKPKTKPMKISKICNISKISAKSIIETETISKTIEPIKIDKIEIEKSTKDTDSEPTIIEPIENVDIETEKIAKDIDREPNFRDKMDIKFIVD